MITAVMASVTLPDFLLFNMNNDNFRILQNILYVDL